jgi:CheY-like chemotaxis protein
MRIDAAAPRGGTGPAPLPPKILIVEDDVLIRAAAAQFLRGTGFTVLEAVDVEQALQLLRTERIVIVFADVKLPGPRNGLDLMRIVQTDFPQSKVLLTSGVVAADEVTLDGVTLMKKPYFLFELERQLRRLLPQMDTGASP